ncbi:MAG: ABC transporter permease subunit [Clostridia bacterium]|nr:ABC transporter permease subunit [Clostridia bacterium]
MQGSASLKFRSKIRKIINCRWLYLMLLPCILNFVIFHYVPMYGLQIAFKRYNIVLGAQASPWIGLKHFENFFSSYYCSEVILNTLRISLVSICVGFPFPIVFALILNEVRSRRARSFFQTVSYLPYFLAVVIVVGILRIFLEQDGIVNAIHQLLYGNKVYYLGEPKYFLTLYESMGLWRWTGYDAILYLAAMSTVNQDLYEAAAVDGAGRLSRIWHVTLPGIRSTIIVLFIMRLGNLLNVGWQEILLLQNDLNEGVSEVIQTFVYKRGIQKADYGFSTAVGLLQSVINFAMIVAANQISKRFSNTYIF